MIWCALTSAPGVRLKGCVSKEKGTTTRNYGIITEANFKVDINCNQTKTITQDNDL